MEPVMNGRWIRLAGACATALLFASNGAAAVATPTTAPNATPAVTGKIIREEALPELDEVTVQGTRLWEMRKRIVEAENRFYALYNQINKDPDYQILCNRYVRTGTHLAARKCVMKYYEDAQYQAARGVFAQLSGSTDEGYAPEAELVGMERLEEARAHVLQVINSDKRLRRMVREREEMEAKFAAERNRRMQGKLIRFD
jgi:hypothetical protein